MKAHIKLGRIFGVAVGLHYSWIIIALLVTLSLRSQFGVDYPDWDLEVMGREDVNQVPVVQQGKLAGIISRGHILRVLQTRAELDV
jgi:hypothetical protein